MNIFVLDHNPTIAAQYHCDKHVVKMILESAQLLSTAYRYHNPDAPTDICYKSTHINHPCSIWVRESKANFAWLVALYSALISEWNYRYQHNKVHKSLTVIGQISPVNFPDIGRTAFVQAMPDDVKNENVVTAYRDYYIKYKSNIATWKRRNKPKWYIDGLHKLGR